MTTNTGSTPSAGPTKQFLADFHAPIVAVCTDTCLQFAQIVFGQLKIYKNKQKTNFDVLLTVHLSIILIINQLNAQNLIL